jgi:hypothetical protein
MKLLVQNNKIKKSGDTTKVVYNFGIPAFKSKQFKMFTCPNASKCVAGCYAKSGTYLFGNVVNAYENRLGATLSTSFVEDMSNEISLLLGKANKQGKSLYIRIHDSGDFYSPEYLQKWLTIINRFSQVEFYAYTKMVSMLKSFYKPKNFRVIYSFGGKEDHLINTVNDNHSVVFETSKVLQSTDYIDCSVNDLNVYLTKKVGLIYHGVKNYKNTKWGNVTKPVESMDSTILVEGRA